MELILAPLFIIGFGVGAILYPFVSLADDLEKEKKRKEDEECARRGRQKAHEEWEKNREDGKKQEEEVAREMEERFKRGWYTLPKSRK